MRRFVLPALLILLLAAPAAADARPVSPKKAIWGPVAVDGRSQFGIYEKLGAGIWQYALRWDQIAPTRPVDPSNPDDPAYQWPAELDQAAGEARRHRMDINLMVLGAPSWANGGRAFNWAPKDPQDFATFVAAAAKRYPSVRYWMIWGEPSKSSNFQPLEPDNGYPLHGRKARRGPELYARILDRSYVALKRVSKRNRVIGGNTFTVGTVGPVHFMRALKLPNGRRPRMDLWGHNAFSARMPRLKRRPLGNGYADFSDIDNFVHKLDRAFPGHLKIFVSEFTVPTDHKNWEFNFYTNRKVQARWIRAALKITRSYKRIATFGYLALYDDPVRPGGDQVERGLITRGGTRKPAFRAFADG